jgi:hypothetical protein
MAFLGNRSVNLLNLHYGIHAIAETGGNAFFAVFLLKAGVSIPGVLLAIAGINLGRFLIRPLILVAGLRLGLKPLVVIGTLAMGAQFLVLARVDGPGWPLVILCALGAVGGTFYWTAYHAYFASLGDSDHRGQQIGLREAVAALVGIVSPLATGWALMTLGPDITFGATALVMATSSLPLILAPNVAVQRGVEGGLKSTWPSILLQAADGWAGAGYLFVWQIALFVTLGENFAAFGGAMALAAVVGAVTGLVLGRWVDMGHGGKAIWLALSSLLVMIGFRAVAFGHPALAVVANAIGPLAWAFYVPTMMTALYNQAQASPCALRFSIATEGGWDAGSIAACLITAGMIQLGVPLGFAIATAALGSLVSFGILRRYFAAGAPETGAPAS